MSIFFERCPSCGSSDTNKIGQIPASDNFAGRKLHSPMEGGFLWECNSCHLAFRYPRLSKVELDKLYSDGDSSVWQANSSRLDWNIAASWIREILPKESNILDIGCFRGQFFEQLGTDYQRFGVEISNSAREIAREKGINLIGTDFEEINSLSPLYDCVVAFDVIEHVHDPAYFMSILSTVARPGAIIIISTGNRNAFSWRFMGAKYWYCTIAEHISFISPRWCKYIAQKMDLYIDKLQLFSHRRRNIASRAQEASKNIFYRLMPRAAGYMRTVGLGGKEAKIYPELAQHPPSWMTAKDHFIVMFRKI